MGNNVANLFAFLNGPTPASFSFIFGLFKQTIQFLQQINVKKCPSSVQYRDLNPQPLGCESPPITTRPGLPKMFVVHVSFSLMIVLFKPPHYSMTRFGEILPLWQRIKVFGKV